MAATPTEQLYTLIGVTKSGQVTLYAVLLFSPYPQAYFPQLGIIAASVPGTELGVLDEKGQRFSDSRRIEGTLSEMLEGTLAFVRSNMRIATRIDPQTGKRTDIPQYPMDAVREAVLNALIHRDYSIQPDTRNPVLVTAMEVLGETENRYSGIPRIQHAMKEMGLPAPVFTDSRGTFTVTLFNGNYAAKQLKEALSVVDEKGLIAFCRTPRSRKDILDYLAIPSRQYAQKRYLEPLIRAGLIAMSEPDHPKSPRQRFYTVMKS